MLKGGYSESSTLIAARGMQETSVTGNAAWEAWKLGLPADLRTLAEEYGPIRTSRHEQQKIVTREALPSIYY